MGQELEIKRVFRLLSELPNVRQIENYGAQDKSRDFRRCFLDGVHGQRTLSCILDMTPLIASTFNPQDRAFSDFEAGKREIVLEILAHVLSHSDTLTDRSDDAIMDL